jgi:hypothetical protein
MYEMFYQCIWLIRILDDIFHSKSSVIIGAVCSATFRSDELPGAVSLPPKSDIVLFKQMLSHICTPAWRLCHEQILLDQDRLHFLPP